MIRGQAWRIIFFSMYLFVCLCPAFVVAGKHFRCGAQASLAVEGGPWSLGSGVTGRGLGRPATCGISVPQAGIKLAFPALEGRFLSTEPPA